MAVEENWIRLSVGKMKLRVIRIGSSRQRQPYLIGTGVGKTAIAEGLAQELLIIKFGNFGDKRVCTLDLSSMVAGTKYRGEFKRE